MRIRTFIAVATLLLVPATTWAQDNPNTATVPASSPFTVGFLDFGIRATSTTGDAAKYERYRDLGDGLFLETARIAFHQNDWVFGFTGNHMGRTDQRMVVTGGKQGKLKGWFMWDQIPMLLSRTTQTFFQGDVINNDGVLRIADPIQSSGQTSGNNIPLLFGPPNTQVFELGTQRHIAETGLQVMATDDLTFRGLFRNTEKTGAIPYGGSFGHSQLVETIAPVDHTIRDAEASAEYAHGRYLLRGGYVGSFFTNANTTLTFDNPFRLTDTTSASSRGRESLPPSNTFFSFNGMASVKLPGHSRATAYLSSGMLQDAGAPIMPLTVNTAITGINPLPRTTVDGKGETMAANLSFTSRPSKKVDFAVKFRSYQYDNQTPVFETFQTAPYDNALTNLTTPIDTEPFGITRRNFDADARFTPMMGTSIDFGYSYQSEARTHRIFEQMVDNGIHVTFDTVGNRWFTVRTKYEHTQRRGDNFDEELLVEISEQTGMRQFDVAPRNRDRFTLVGVVTPVANLALNVSAATGNDDYLESLMGLRDNNHRIYSGGIDWTPRDNIALNLSYNRENYLSLARSRQANPTTPTGCVSIFPAPTGQTTCQFDDPTRNWAVDTNELVHSIILNAEFNNLWNKVDLRLSVDSNRSKGTYHYITGPVPNRTLPEETPDLGTTLPDPVQLPDVLSNLDRGTLDFVYNFNRRVGLGLSYWYEKYSVQDFALDAESIKNAVSSSAVLLGYMYTPYTAQTGWLRLIVRW